jgi:hypothetical protein
MSNPNGFDAFTTFLKNVPPTKEITRPVVCDTL